MSAAHSPRRQRRTASRLAESGTTHPDGRALRILVIDGDDAVARRSRSALEAAGFEVATADLPDIGIVRRVAPDAIVLGLFFRGQASGLDFLERHVADPIAGATPIIVHVTKQPLELEHARRLQAASCPAPPKAHLAQVAACLRRWASADALAARRFSERAAVGLRPNKLSSRRDNVTQGVFCHHPGHDHQPSPGRLRLHRLRRPNLAHQAAVFSSQRRRGRL